MTPRMYRMTSRAAAAQATRQKIVRATMALHYERGILATSHKDIAARAEVSVGTVYHHFPTQDAIVRACGAETREEHPVPEPGAVDVRAPLGRRIAQLAAIMVDMYAGMPWIERLRLERDRIPALDAGFTLRDRAVDALVRRALGRHARRKSAVAIVTAVLDAPAVHRLLSAGLSSREASRALAALVQSWIEGEDR